MCQNNLEIKFCTCGNNDELENNEYIWTLNRLVDKKKDTMVVKWLCQTMTWAEVLRLRT